MGLTESLGPSASSTPPPWWTVDGAEIPFDLLETTDLPDELDLSHKLIRALAKAYREQKEHIETLRQQLDAQLRHRFGKRSKKRGKPDAQEGEGQSSGSATGGAPDGAKSAGPTPSTGTTGEGSAEGSADGKPSDRPRRGHGRQKVPPDLPQDEVKIDLPADAKCCDFCGGALKQMGDGLESFQYDYKPATLRVRKTVRLQYACKDGTCPGKPKVAPMPIQPIDKGKATGGFLAHVLVSKFLDHIPLYRFSQIVLRQGVKLPLSTLVGWVAQTGDLLVPLYELLRLETLASFAIQTDDSPVLVLEPGSKSTHKGHLWVYRGDAVHPYVVFDFTPDWSGKRPREFLADFRGYIQADAYKGYDALFTPDSGRIEVGCWAHARGGFDDALSASPGLAGEALDRIAKLYIVEKLATDRTTDERRAMREELSRPALALMREWLDQHTGRVVPKSPLGKAIGYANNQWAALTRYVDDGRLDIDNNAVEREIKRIALGRKNWMFCGSDAGGRTSAIAYTVLASAVRCGAEPVAYMTDVLNLIRTLPVDRLCELLPDRWKARQDEERAKLAATAAPAEEEERREAG